MEHFRNLSEEDGVKAMLNTTGTLAEDPFTLERIILHCILSPVIIILGIVGNIMTTIVLHQLREKTSSAQFLFSLAVSDTLTLLLRIVYMVSVWAYLFFPSHVSPWFLNSHSSVTISHAVERVSKMIVVAIVIERVVAVHLPFKVRIIFTRIRVKIAIVLLYILTLGGSLPQSIELFIWDVKNKMDTNSTTQQDPLAYLKFSLHTSPARVIYIATGRILFDALPIPLVAACNLAIIIGLKQKKRLADSTIHSLRKAKERKLTRLLLIVSFCFLILCGPFDIYILFLITSTVDLSNNVLIINEILKTVSLLNSSINFIIYAFMNKRYRQKYAEIFLYCCRNEGIERKTKGDHTKGTTTPQISSISGMNSS